MARKSRGASRRRSTRRSGRRSGQGLFVTLYTPIGEAIDAVDSLARIAANTATGIVHTALQGANKAGKRVTSSANAAVRKTLFTRKQRK